MKTMIPISKLMPKYCELFGAIKFISNVVCGTPYNKNCESVQSKLERLLFHWVMFLSTLIVATINLCYPVTVIIYIDGKSKNFILGFLIRPYDWSVDLIMIMSTFQLYWIGPLVGSAVAALLYDFIFATNATPAKFTGFFRRDYDDSNYDKHGRRSPVSNSSEMKE